MGDEAAEAFPSKWGCGVAADACVGPGVWGLVVAPSGVAPRWVPVGNAAEGIPQVRVEPPAAPGHSPVCRRMETVQRGSEPVSLGCVQPGSCPQSSAFPGMEWPMPSGPDAIGIVVLQKGL